MIIGLSILNAELIRHNRYPLVKDTVLNLEWQDNKINDSMSNIDAVRHCANLSLRGTGWRLPNQEELRSIVDKENFYPSIASAFIYTTTSQSNSMYWTSTKYEGNKNAAWLVGFWGGGDHYSTTKFKANVRCVRKAN